MIRNLSGALDCQKETPDFLEATVYSRNEAVIMVGNFADVKTKEEKNKVSLLFKNYECNEMNEGQVNQEMNEFVFCWRLTE